MCAQIPLMKIFRGSAESCFGSIKVEPLIIAKDQFTAPLEPPPTSKKHASQLEETEEQTQHRQGSVFTVVHSLGMMIDSSHQQKFVGKLSWFLPWLCRGRSQPLLHKSNDSSYHCTCRALNLLLAAVAFPGGHRLLFLFKLQK